MRAERNFRAHSGGRRELDVLSDDFGLKLETCTCENVRTSRELHKIISLYHAYSDALLESKE